MNIAIITSTFPPYHGGMGAVAKQQAEIFSGLGHRVTVLTGAEGIDETSQSYSIKRIRPFFRIGNGAFLPQIFLSLKNFDTVILHYPAFGLLESVLFWRFLFGRKKKFFVFYHMDPIASGIRGLIFRLITAVSGRLILRAADKIFVTTKDYAMNGFLGTMSPSISQKWIEMPLAVDTDFFCPLDPHVREDGKILLSEKNILFVGGMDRAHDFKGLPELLKAFAVAKIPGATLHLVGDGELRSQYEQQSRGLNIASAVIFHGSLFGKAFREVCDKSDVLVLPSISRSEAFGVVLLEAMACGKPVIASDLPGVRTVIENGKTGRLVPPRDVDALAACLKNACADPLRLQKMGSDARARVLENYSLPVLCERWKSFFSIL